MYVGELRLSVAPIGMGMVLPLEFIRPHRGKITPIKSIYGLEPAHPGAARRGTPRRGAARRAKTMPGEATSLFIHWRAGNPTDRKLHSSDGPGMKV